MASEPTFTRTLLLLLALVVIIPFLMMVIMIPLMWFLGGGHMASGMWNGMGPSLWWPVLWLTILGVVVGFGYLVYRSVQQTDDERSDPALEELRLAYARGELSDEEYERRLERLQRER